MSLWEQIPEEPMWLVLGLGAQIIEWDDGFCKALAGQGYWVIRFDNRDIGLSTKFTEAGVPNTMALMEEKPVNVSYLLRDMALDTVGLLDALGMEILFNRHSKYSLSPFIGELPPSKYVDEYTSELLLL